MSQKLEPQFLIVFAADDPGFVQVVSSREHAEQVVTDYGIDPIVYDNEGYLYWADIEREKLWIGEATRGGFVGGRKAAGSPDLDGLRDRIMVSLNANGELELMHRMQGMNARELLEIFKQHNEERSRTSGKAAKIGFLIFLLIVVMIIVWYSI